MSNNQQHGALEESSGLIENGQQEPDEVEKKTKRSTIFSIGVGVTITVLLVVFGVFLVSGSTNAPSENKVFQYHSSTKLCTGRYWRKQEIADKIAGGAGVAPFFRSPTVRRIAGESAPSC